MSKNSWLFLIFVLCGIVIGGLIGELSSTVTWLKWLSYGQSFGITQPVVLDMGVLKLTFALTIKINIVSIVGIIIAIFLYKKF